MEKKKSPKVKKIIHPWRLCPEGEHWVITHPMHVPPSKRNPSGMFTTRHGHCAHNPSGKDKLYPDEIKEIAERNFSKLKNMPCNLNLGYKNGSIFDDFIAGWVQYWNEVFNPSELLDPNLVKALIASESGFDPTMLANKKNSNSARGLMQIMNGTREILGDVKGELKDHYLTVTKEELNDPNVNICAGIRWLFQKKKLASKLLKRDANWVETVAEYKGDLKGILNKNKKSQKDMAPFLKFLKEAQECNGK